MSSLRITSGQYRSFRLKGSFSAEVRPSSERVRQSVFNILGNDLKDICFLDLYSGSGINGFEALSRGAERVEWVDKSRENSRFIKENLENMVESPSNHQIHTSLVLNFLKRSHASFHIIYMDPPFQKEAEDRESYEYEEVLKELGRSSILAPNGILMVEYAKRYPISQDTGLFELVDERSYGTVGVRFLRKKTEEAS